MKVVRFKVKTVKYMLVSLLSAVFIISVIKVHKAGLNDGNNSKVKGAKVKQVDAESIETSSAYSSMTTGMDRAGSSFKERGTLSSDELGQLKKFNVVNSPDQKETVKRKKGNGDEKPDNRVNKRGDNLNQEQGAQLPILPFVEQKAKKKPKQKQIIPKEEMVIRNKKQKQIIPKEEMIIKNKKQKQKQIIPKEEMKIENKKQKQIIPKEERIIKNKKRIQEKPENITANEKAVTEEVIKEEDKITLQEIEEFNQENTNRVNKVKEECSKFFSGQKFDFVKVVPEHVKKVHPKAELFTISKEKNLTWCRSGKIGTTTWSVLFSRMFGQDKLSSRLHMQAKKLEREMITSAQKRGTIASLRKPNPINRGMVAARHPIDRLMSAYKDKIARRRIVLNGVNTKSLKPTFAKFLVSIVKQAPAHQNKHWKPNWVLCNPCMYHYTYILKMETFDRDSGAVLKLINSGIDTKINRFNASKNPAPTDYAKMLEDVDSATLEKILSMYYLDFKLFDYDIQTFINILDSKRASEQNSGKDNP